VSSSADEPLHLGVIAPTSSVARLAILPAARASATISLVAAASSPGRGEWTDPQLAGVTRHLDYGSLLADPAVEAVYLPLPNSLHREWTERCAAAGKHVLCEKPLATTEADALAMGRACESAAVVLMEAYMTPFHPRAARVSALVAAGALGRLLFARAAFTGTLDRPDDHRWRPEMGGGALLDVGIYCLAPLLELAGRDPRTVDRFAAAAHWSESGVDASFSAWLDLGGGAGGTIECSFEAPERQLLELVGDEASVVVDRAYTPGLSDTDIQLLGRDGRREALVAAGGDPYQAMLEHFAEVVRGRSPLRRTPEASAGLAGLVERLTAAARR
jgi:D-xylose 1-dehydrogenase (NADP+, D-xylono-1,5-lactone-forming)